MGAVTMNRQECEDFYTWMQLPNIPDRVSGFGSNGATLVGTEMTDVTGDALYGYGCQIWPTSTQVTVYYDDDASGAPGNSEPFKGGLRSHLVGAAEGQGVVVPLLDSMKVGKQARA